jgi:1-deoxy-D-xylulose-5-phosphate reductoisomerase
VTRRVAVLGATGSIGDSALDVIARHPDRFRATVLSANEKVDDLIELCRRFRPDAAVIADESKFATLRDGLRGAGLATHAHAGTQALSDLAGSDHCDTVIAAIVGAAGLNSTLAAARAGKRILLANKEAVVVAGALLMHEVAAHGAEIVPIDSEHNAIFQCLPHPALGAAARPGVRRLLLTASGGPFRGWDRARLAAVTPEQACAHPNWSMGRKISVDSATLMNKGLEVIEAHWLFGLPRPSASRWWCTRRASCIRWSSTPTGRSWPSSAIPTCAPHSRTDWPGQSGSKPGSPHSTSPPWAGSISSLPT